MCSFFCSIKSIFDPLHCYLELLVVQGKNDSKPTKFSATKLRSRNKVDLVLVKQLLEQIHLSFPGDCLQVHTEVSPNKKTSLNQNRMSFDNFFMSWRLDAIAFGTLVTGAFATLQSLNMPTKKVVNSKTL